MTYAPVDKFGFANVNLCSLSHDPWTMQLGLLTRESCTVSKGNLREEKFFEFKNVFKSFVHIYTMAMLGTPRK